MMKSILKNIIFFSVIAFCFMNLQCEDDDDVIDSICDEVTVVNKDIYDNLVSDDFQFVEVAITDDCLNIKISASGCDGATWGFELVDSGAVAESSPEQRYLKFQLVNEELCDAVIQKTISFDLRPLQIQGSTKIILNIEGLQESVTYSY
ncbi:hypothetical protein [Algibacter sp. 2305UL17-15]|uniref:hypothetical protein n=1 Tax=Algibacter sp. 2305UL17-15 TaxID=3231268 RepID=UPI003458AA8A